MSAVATESSLVIINESNLNTGIVHKEHNVINAAYFWHKIYVQNATKYSRDFVLRTIMNAVHPLDFVPVCYSIEGEYCTFMLKNCGGAITEMCRLNLTIPHPDIQKNLPPFKLAIALKHSHASELRIEIQSNISSILRRRYNNRTKTLNLEAFIKDPDLIEFYPLSQPKLMYFVLHLSRDMEIEGLRLNYNEIEVLKPLEALAHDRNHKALTNLDLRRNNIIDPEQLLVLKPFAITELTLEENPICDKLTEQEYVKMVRECCPKIIKLDGCRVPPVGMLALRRNYLCNINGQTLVDQFLEHYFTLYDSYNRSLLINMYHKCALFSITSQWANDPGAPNSSAVSAKLYEYKKYSRNLKTLSDFSKCDEYLFNGIKDIGNILKALPPTEHDPYTFTVDLIQYTEKSAFITVTGVFKEPGESLLASDYYFGFTRTFLLKAVSNLEYVIVNEMLHVSNATMSQQQRAFKIVKVPRASHINVPVAQTPNEKNEMMNALVAITNLRPEWATKCLKECEYDLKNAVAMFMDLFKADRIPSFAFDFSDMEAENALQITQQIKSLPTQTRLQPMSSESIRAHLQPVHKVIQINTNAHSLLPTAVPMMQTIPVQTHQQQQPKPLLKPLTPKQERRLQRLQQQKAITISLEKDKVPPTQPNSSTRPIDSKTISMVPTVVSKNKATSSQSQSQPQKPKSSPKPEHKTDKPADRPTEKQEKDNATAISTNIDDLKKYVKDPLILSVLNMTPDTSIDKVKENLTQACKQVLKAYTFALKYYKAVGREFYRFQLFSEARTFLTDAMAIVPKQMGEQLYFIFTLFEIQYGDVNVAENMILIIAETFQIEKTAHFVSHDIAKINIPFARKLFSTIAISNLPMVKKEVLLKAYIDFEKTYGNIESMKHANKVYQDMRNATGTKQQAEKEREKEREEREWDKQQEKEREKREWDKQQEKEREKEKHQDKQDATESKNKEAPVEVAPKEKEPDKPKPSTVVEKPIIAKPTAKEIAARAFFDFRLRLLKRCEIMPCTVEAPKVTQFDQCKDKETVIKLGEVLLQEFPGNFYIVRCVCKKWQKFGLNTKVAKSLADVRKYFQEDIKILNPLILYLKVREDLDKKRDDVAKNKLFTHIKISTYVQVVQVFEDLIADGTDKPFLDSTMNEAASNVHFPASKVKLLTLLYLGFCKKEGNTNADALYKQHFHGVQAYFPDYIGDLDHIKKQRAMYEHGKRDIPSGHLELKTLSFEDQLERVRMHYFFGLLKRGRALLERMQLSATKENVQKFNLSRCYYEAIFHSIPHAARTHSQYHGDETFNSTFISLTASIRNHDSDVWTKLNGIFKDVLLIMNPNVQELLYHYHKKWLTFDFDIFSSN